MPGAFPLSRLSVRLFLPGLLLFPLDGWLFPANGRTLSGSAARVFASRLRSRSVGPNDIEIPLPEYNIPIQ